MNIKEWAPDDRPREKVLSKGIQALSDAELIAILIGRVSSGESAVELARTLLHGSDNSFSQLSKLSVKEMTRKYKGIGPAKAITIAAALEIGKRRSQSEALQLFSVKSSRDVYNYLQPLMADLPHEEFWTLYLNQSNRIVYKRQISRGGVSETAVDIRIILKDALEYLASGIIICHNHPSGNTRPSHVDDAFTRKMKEAAKMIDVRVLDHLIICEHGYYSYADEGSI